jgi:hypothetical protein
LGYTLVSASKVGSDNTDDGSEFQVATFTCSGTEEMLASCTAGDVYSDTSNNHAFDVGVSCIFIAPDDECEECVAGTFSDNVGVAACTNCAAGSYSTVVGSVSAADCQQVRIEEGKARR